MEKEALKKLVIGMIVDDLVHNKLIHGLMALEIEAGYYSIDLSEKVIALLGFTEEQNEFVAEYYNRLMEGGSRISVNGNIHEMRELANKVYDDLLRLKEFILADK
ncbi:MAG: hypothetical protein V4615_02430 [Bacteroidota bacterium]